MRNSHAFSPWRIPRRRLALLLSFSCALSSAPWPAAWAEPPELNPDPAPIDSMLADPAGIEIPEGLGYRAGIALPEGPPERLVIYIQDLHANPSAQHSIASLLRHFARYGVRLLASEAAEGLCLTDLYAAMPDPEGTLKIFEALMDQGLVTGAEYAALAQPDSLKLFGVDDAAAYEANRAVFIEARAREAEAERYWREWDAVLERRLSESLPAGMLKLRKDRDTLAKDGADLQGFLRTLLEESRRLGVSLEPYPNAVVFERLSAAHQARDAAGMQAVFQRVGQDVLQRLDPAAKAELDRLRKAMGADMDASLQYTLGLIRSARRLRAGDNAADIAALESYAEFLRQRLTLDVAALAREMEALATEVLFAGAGASAEALLQEAERWRLLSRLFMLEMTPEDWQTLNAHPEYFTRGALERMAAELQAGPADDAIEAIENLIVLRRNFYGLAELRDTALAANLKATMASEAAPAAVLVAGGFHAAGVARRLVAGGAAVVTVVPAASEMIDPEVYHDLLTGFRPEIRSEWFASRYGALGVPLSTRAPSPAITEASARATHLPPLSDAGALRADYGLDDREWLFLRVVFEKTFARMVSANGFVDGQLNDLQGWLTSYAKELVPQLEIEVNGQGAIVQRVAGPVLARMDPRGVIEWSAGVLDARPDFESRLNGNETISAELLLGLTRGEGEGPPDTSPQVNPIDDWDSRPFERLMDTPLIQPDAPMLALLQERGIATVGQLRQRVPLRNVSEIAAADWGLLDNLLVVGSHAQLPIPEGWTGRAAADLVQPALDHTERIVAALAQSGIATVEQLQERVLHWQVTGDGIAGLSVPAMMELEGAFIALLDDVPVEAFAAQPLVPDDGNIAAALKASGAVSVNDVRDRVLQWEISGTPVDGLDEAQMARLQRAFLALAAVRLNALGRNDLMMTDLQPQKVLYIATRVGGLDGVSLEMEKQAIIFSDAGHEAYAMSGAGDMAVASRTFRLPSEAAFDDPMNQEIVAWFFPDMAPTNLLPSLEKIRADYPNGPDPARKLELLRHLEGASDRLAEEIVKVIDEQGITVMIPHNTNSLPFQIVLAVAIAKAARMRPEIALLPQGHDFYWERPWGQRVAPEAVPYLSMAVPIRGERVIQLVIQSLMMEQLESMGMSSLLMPNLMDFTQRPKHSEEMERKLRAAFALDENTTLFIQPTRIIERKGMEMDGKLAQSISRKGGKIAVIVTGFEKDTEPGYKRDLIAYYKKLGVDAQILFMDDRLVVEHEPSEGDGKFTLEDVYAAVWLGLYPSTYEGFGNALEEMPYASIVPILFAYLVYLRDIAPRGPIHLPEFPRMIELMNRFGYIPAATLRDALDSGVYDAEFDNLADWVLALARKPKARQRVVEEARAVFAAVFSYDAGSSAFARTLHAVMGDAVLKAGVTVPEGRPADVRGPYWQQAQPARGNGRTAGSIAASGNGRGPGASAPPPNGAGNGRRPAGVDARVDAQRRAERSL